jgi:DNA replication protein DnaC
VSELRCHRCGEPVPPVPADVPEWLRKHQVAVEPTCDDCAEEAEREAERVEREERERERAERVRRRRENVGLPAELRGHTWDELDVDEHNRLAIPAAQAWARDELGGLVFTGAQGVGKTLPAAIAAAQLSERRSVRWLYVPVLFAHLDSQFENPARERALRVLAAETALVLDDLDKAKPKEEAAGRLLAAIDVRLTAGAPLLVTTNLSMSAIADKWGDSYGHAIADRLAKECEVHRLTGDSRRRLRRAA